MSGKMVIPGYKITEFVYNHSHMKIYRGIRTLDSLAVIIKTPQEGHFGKNALLKLKHEYRILQSLQSPAVERAIALLKSNRETVLITEDYGGIPLSHFLKMRELTIEEILSISIQIAACIGEVHQERIIHKDINPSHILIHPTSFEVKLINFGIATRLYHDYQGVMNAKEWQGNLRYLAPEQTGRMNRTVDYRADFYSFGITLYEMLTGKPPFLFSDMLELVHAHMARKPIPPCETNPAIPQALSDIVMKCLRKNAEDRYLSSTGLIADLQQCLQQLNTSGSIAPFPLARFDRIDRLHISERLYGRERELRLLTDAFEQASNGAARLVMLSGSAGVGKSALVLEAQKTFLQGKGRFVSGKFDQYKQSVPYSAMIQMFQDLIRQILTERERELNAWRETILEAMQGLGQVIVDVIPQLETIIGKQPPVPELPATEAKNRFQIVMQRFVRIWARPEHPLVLFLDDLQWADTASMLLIQEMISDLQLRNFLLICAYREQDGSGAHRIVSMLEEARLPNGMTRHISLQPMREAEISRLLADTLYAEPQETMPLTKILLQKTEGNPFYLKQFLISLHERNLMQFVPGEGRWRWDLEIIEKLGAADNVADFLVEKMLRLPVVTQKLLAFAACLGSDFFLHMVAKARNQKEAEAIRHLWPAIEEGLLSPLEGEEYLAYPATDEEETVGQVTIRLAFVHDRIQQAAYSLLSDMERKMVHLKLGRMMWQLNDSFESSLLFEICDHMHQGAELIEDQSERMQVAHCHLLAGQRAKMSTAFDSALKYFRHGTEILPDEVWEQNHHLMIELYTLRSEAEYLCNHFEEAEALFELVLEHARTNAQRVRILEIKVRMNTSLAKFPLVVDYANQALQLLGVPIPQKPGKLDVIKEMWQVKRKLKGRKTEDLLYIPNVPDENYKMAMNIISYAGPSSYFVNLNWFALTILRVLHLSLVHGNAVASANGYTGFGIVQASQFGNYQEAYEFGQLACSVAETFNDPLAKTKAYGALAILINHWRDHARTNIPLLKKAIQYGLESGGNIYVAYNAHGMLEAMLYCGMPIEELIQQIPEHAELIRQVKVVDHDDRLLLLRQAMHCLTNLEGDDHTAFREDGFDEAAYVKGLQADGNHYKRYMYNYYKSMVLQLFGKYREAADLSIEAEKWMESVSGQLLVSQHVFVQTLSLTALYPQGNRIEKRAYGKKIKANLKKMNSWAKHCPENFMHKYLLMNAEWQKVSGDKQEASSLYEQSIQLARKDGFVQNEALACELAAKYYLSLGLETIARVYLSEAHEAYLQWGAHAKARDLEAQYPQYLVRSRTNSAADMSATDQSPDIVDLMTVIKASQTIASEIKLEKLLATMLHTVMSNAGAQKGFLILKNESEWFIEAAGYVDEDVEIMQSIPYEQGCLLSVATVNYVIRTEEMLVLHEASIEGIFFKDVYITMNKPKSILCAPLWQQGKMIGVIYLENNESTHVFNEERTELLRLIFSQIATFIENARLYHQLEQWNQSLEKIVAERTDEIETLLRANKNLLNNAGQGFLSFSRDMLVDSEYSRECLRMFGKEIAGHSVAELLYPENEEEQGFIQSLLEKYFETPDAAQKELYLSLFPTEITVNRLPLKLECKPIQEIRGECSNGVMLILTDQSEKRALEGKIEQEWHSLKMVVAVAISLELFHGVLHHFTAFLDRDWKAILSEDGEFSKRIFKLLGRIHQFKGDMSQFYLIHTPARLHEMETALVELARQEQGCTISEIGERVQIESVQAALQQDLMIIRKQLGDNFLEKKEQAISFSKDRWTHFEANLRDLLQGEEHQELSGLLRQLHYRPFTELLSLHADYVANVAARLDKWVHPLQIESEEIWVDPERFGNFANSLIHVLGNAIDHGIEDETERLAGNKEKWGKIRCDLKQEGNTILMSIADDGRGIDLDRVKTIGRQKGLDAHWSDEEWLAQIFVDDFSLKEEINEVSGRGVGLSIVKREVDRLGGTVEVSTRKGEGTRFLFRLPLEDKNSVPNRKN